MLLYEHLQATDPERFIVATRPDGDAVGGERVIGFASAVVRGASWLLSMLFVLPEEQGLGLGRALIEAVLPPADAGLALNTAIDSAQPISLALYSKYGIVPRMPVLDLVGELRRPAAFPPLPAGVTATPFESIAAGPPGGDGHRELMGAVAALDLEVAGFDHPQDHRYLRTRDRHGFLYRDGEGAVLGYGYGSEVGRVGPVAVRAPELIAPVLGHLFGAIRARGAYAVWVPGRPRTRSRHSWRPGCASTASRSSSAGTARSSTTPDTCRSRRDCCSDRSKRPDATHGISRPRSGGPMDQFASPVSRERLLGPRSGQPGASDTGPVPSWFASGQIRDRAGARVCRSEATGGSLVVVAPPSVPVVGVDGSRGGRRRRQPRRPRRSA